MKAYCLINRRFNHHTKEYENDLASIEAFESKLERDKAVNACRASKGGIWVKFEIKIK